MISPVKLTRVAAPVDAWAQLPFVVRAKLTAMGVTPPPAQKGRAASLNPLLGGPLKLPQTSTGWWKIAIGSGGANQSWKFDTEHRSRALSVAKALRALGLSATIEQSTKPDVIWRKAANMKAKEVVAKVHSHLLPSANQLARWRDEAQAAATRSSKA